MVTATRRFCDGTPRAEPIAPEQQDCLVEQLGPDPRKRHGATERLASLNHSLGHLSRLGMGR